MFTDYLKKQRLFLEDQFNDVETLYYSLLHYEMTTEKQKPAKITEALSEFNTLLYLANQILPPYKMAYALLIEPEEKHSTINIELITDSYDMTSFIRDTLKLENRFKLYAMAQNSGQLAQLNKFGDYIFIDHK